MRDLLAAVMPRPRLFRMALTGGAWAASRWPACCRGGSAPCWRLGAGQAAAALAGRPAADLPGQGPAQGAVALLAGCAQQVLAPQINEATVRLLTRHGVEVVVAEGRRLLRRARTTTWATRSRRCARQGQHRRLDARAGAAAARRHRDQRLGLRHDRQGLRLHAARGSGL